MTNTASRFPCLSFSSRSRASELPRLRALALAHFLILPLAAIADTEGPYTYTVTNNQATITDFDIAYSGELSITNSLGGYPVTSIGSYAFYEHFSLTSVIIPDSVIFIDEYAFAKCVSLTSVTLPDRVTNIGCSTFSTCSALASVTIPDSVTNIGYGAFFGCSTLTFVTIPGSVTNVEGYAFQYCPSLASVLFTGDAPLALSSTAFENTPVTIFYLPDTSGWGTSFAGRPAKLLFSYAIENGGVTISEVDTTFTGNFLIPEVLAGLPVTTIGDFALNLSDVTSVTIPDSVTSISYGTFYNCQALTSVTIPDSIVSIGEWAFYRCVSLASITLPDGVTNIGEYAFQSCTSLTSVNIPDSITDIGQGAFSLCTSLTSITIPGSVTNIGSSAFSCCSSLTSVTIPSSVEYIDWVAFASCDLLSSVLFTGAAPTVDPEAFLDTPATIYYLPNTTGWSDTVAGRPAVCWNPAVQQDASFGFTPDRFGFSIVGTTNIPIVVQASTNLASGVWTSLTNTNLGTSGSFHFIDQSSTNQPSRFYRIVWP